MKKTLSIILAACMALTIVGCGSENDSTSSNGSEKKQTKESQNISNGYNFIEPNISLGIERSKLPEDRIIEDSEIDDLVFGQKLVFEDIEFYPSYNWLGSDGESLNLIEYSAAPIDEEGYNKILSIMKEKYGSEPSTLVEEEHSDVVDMNQPVTEPSETNEAAATATPDATAAEQQEEASADEFPPLQWEEDGILISLLYLDNKLMIRFTNNKQ